VALAEDRDRRADSPDEGNRCYAEKAPRRRDLVYQSDYCYSPQFAACSTFLAWAARNAAEPAYVTEVAQKAWGSGITAPEAGSTLSLDADADAGAIADADTGAIADADAGQALPPPTPEGGLFGPPDPAEGDEARGTRELDWVSASAWADAPWDERAEQEADEREALADDEPDDELEAADQAPKEEATQGPKVPAALPMRRRKPPLQPIRARGSGEWFYADPPGHEPLVRRRYGVTPPILLAVLALLVVSIVVFLIATQIGGGGPGGQAAAPSPSAAASLEPEPTRAPLATVAPTAEPSPTPVPKRRFYTVKPGDSLTKIANKFGVDPRHLQCLNGILNRNIVVLGARYEIPPEGFTCPPGWRRALQEG
jgi:LysM repeat protein